MVRHILPLVCALLPLTLAACSDSTEDGASPAVDGGTGGQVGNDAATGGDSASHVDALTGVDAAVPPSCPSPSTSGTVYYVDGAQGDDSRDGKSEQNAFKTIARAVQGSSAPVGPGDTVMIKGGVYRERVRINKSGESGRPILIRPFSEQDVVVDGSDDPGTWTLDSGQIYRAHPGFDVQAVVVGGVPLIPSTTEAPQAAGEYAQLASGDLLVWTPSGASPASESTGVIAVDEEKTQNAVYIENANHVLLCGITTQFAGAKGILILGDHNRITLCKTQFNGGMGLSVGPWESTLSVGNEIIGNEIYHNYLRNWPRCANDYKWAGWGTGASSQGAPGTIFSGNTVHKNGGEGIVIYGSTEPSVIQNNAVFDNWSVNIYVLNTQNVTIDGNLVLSHDPDLSDLRNNGDPDPSDGTCARRLRPVGIATGDEQLDDNIPLVEHVSITNNIIVGCSAGFTHVNEHDGSGLKDLRFAFNTVVMPTQVAGDQTMIALDIPYNDGLNRNAVFRNNILVGNAAGVWMLSADGDGDLFQNVLLTHNLFYHPANPNSIHWGPTWDNLYSHSEWVALPGSEHGTGDVEGDPALGDVWQFDPNSACPGAGSPAIDHGVDVSVRSDYFHATRPKGAGFDIGACEVGQ